MWVVNVGPLSPDGALYPQSRVIFEAVYNSILKIYLIISYGSYFFSTPVYPGSPFSLLFFRPTQVVPYSQRTSKVGEYHFLTQLYIPPRIPTKMSLPQLLSKNKLVDSWRECNPTKSNTLITHIHTKRSLALTYF